MKRRSSSAKKKVGPKSVDQKIRERITKTSGGHWLYRGAKNSSGYATVWVNGKSKYLHVYNWEKRNGRTKPPGKVIDHKCRVRGCSNPAHLRLMTGKQNTRIGVGPTGKNAQKKTCSRGHALTGSNVYSYRGKDGSIHRHCKKCRNLRSRK